jgi:glycosyltransferase involved in cell wall biosynthesis
VRWEVAPRPTRVPFAKRRGFAFIGGYGHPANLDAARWLISEIIPLVHAQEPGLECLLVGDGMPDGLRQRCGNGVVALGQVNDISEIFDRVRLTVAPLRYGAGIKGKVVDSLAAGVPCVLSPIAAEGLPLPRELRRSIASDVDEIAALIVRLHQDGHANAAAATAGHAMIRDEFTFAQVTEALRDAVTQGGIATRIGLHDALTQAPEAPKTAWNCRISKGRSE